MKNVKLVNLKKYTDERGNLIPIEFPKNLPFEIKRIYYIYGVPNNLERGFHSHRELEQILISLGGSVKIRTKNPFEEEIYCLSDPSTALYIGPYIWREMYDFDENTTLLVLASKEYDENDYLKDYDEYKEEYKKTYNN